MELDEFKELWKSKSERDSLEDNIKTEKINSIIMNTTLALEKIKKENDFWYNITLRVIQLYIGIFVAYVIIFTAIQWFIPGLIKNAISWFSIVYHCVVIAALYLTLYAYKLQNRIFEFDGRASLKSSVQTSIKRFNSFYRTVMVASVPITFLLLYLAAIFLMQSLNREISFYTNFLISSFLTVVTMVSTHIYYKKTYFKWLRSLENHLEELEEES